MDKRAFQRFQRRLAKQLDRKNIVLVESQIVEDKDDNFTYVQGLCTFAKTFSMRINGKITPETLKTLDTKIMELLVRELSYRS